jgi:hypothetical protein
MSVEIVCPQCGYSKEVSEEKIPPGVKWANCPRCKNRFELHLQRALPAQETVKEEETAPGFEGGTPWERRSEIGVWTGLYRTTTGVLFSPRHFFGTMTTGTGLTEPFAYGVLSGVIGTMCGLFWHFLVMSGSIRSLIQLNPIGMAAIFAAVLLFAIPYVLVVMLLTSLVLHGCLVLLRGGRNGFEGTFRVVAYSQATQVLSFIPFLGGIAAFLWLFVVQVIGLKEIHETSYGKIILAYLIPFIVLFGVVAVVVVFLSFVLLQF